MSEAVADRIEQIANDERVAAALAAFRDNVEAAIELAIAVQQIPAPTFAEAERAAFVQRWFEQLDLADIAQNDLHNVYGRFPGRAPTSASPVIVSAHTDTVFAADTDLTIRRENQRIYGPGLSDNATGVAGLLLLAQALRDYELRPSTDIWLVANVGEEGLGDLRGMRAVFDRFGPEAAYIVLEGGLFGQISHQAIGVRRFRITVETAGGHSWGSFGAPSAIHYLGHLIVAIDSLAVPQQPKTTYNVGVVEGGTSVNTIAANASLLLDLRSEDPDMLSPLVEEVGQIVDRLQIQVDEEEHRDGRGVVFRMEQIGDRPAGGIARETELVQWAQAALRHVGVSSVSFINSSTDANIPLSQGATAVCIGLTESGNAHRLDEYLDPTNLPRGLSQLLLLTLAATGFEPG